MAAKKKADLVAEAEAAGVEDAEDLKVDELKEAIAEAEEEATEEADTLSGSVRAVSEGGVAYLEFGSVTPGEDEAVWEASHRHALSRDDAVGLINDLPNVLADANTTAAHVG